MTMESFRTKGREELGDKPFEDLYVEVSAVEIDCQFLVAGHDCVNQPHVFTVSNPGVAKSQDKPRFWAIGSGATSALSMLFFRGQNIITPIESTIYNVLEAKFMAESASDVGEKTFCWARKPTHERMKIPYEIVEASREKWQKEGQPRVPNGIEEFIKGKIAESQGKSESDQEEHTERDDADPSPQPTKQ
jgi:hypothetical protein